MINLTTWKNQLGLLPLPLFSSGENNEFILLNGKSGNFCMGINNERVDNHYSDAWSSNTKHFVAQNNDKISVFNWLKGKKEEYNVSLVMDNLSTFYEYMLKDSYESQYDIVPYIMGFYKRLRVELNEERSGHEAVKQLLLLLATHKCGGNIDEATKTEWGISDIQAIGKMSVFLDELGRGIPDKTLEPNIDLILRHASGQLFQEAQKEAVFPYRSLTLWGTYESEYISQKELYSSFHYTPSFLARSIVECALSKIDLENKSNLKILDPACGSSEFLLEALKQLRALNYRGQVSIVAWDSSESAISISQFLLHYQKREWADNLSLDISRVDNSLTQAWDNDYDIILMNPPFLSWELMTKQDREIVAETSKEIFSTRKPNLASAFLYKCLLHLKKEGVIGTVIPSSIFTSDSYKKLRTAVQQAVSLQLIGKLGNYVFENALTDVSIFVGKKPTSSATPLLLWSKNESGIIADALRDLRKVNYGQLPYVKDNDNYNIFHPDVFPDGDNWKVIPFHSLKMKDVLEKLIIAEKLTTVSSVFSVKQGIRTGNNKVFKITKEFYNDLPDDEKNFFRPAIDNDSIQNGTLNITNYVWYPYLSSGAIFKKEEDFKKNAPVFYKNLLLQQQALLKRKGVDNWWELTRPRNWQFKKKTNLTSTEFGKAGSFALNQKGDFVVERGNAWIPKKEFPNNDYYYFYLCIFNSNFFNELLSIYSRQLAGGNWYDLGMMHTKDIPIPLITREFEGTALFSRLVYLGKQICDGQLYNFSLIDDDVKRTYGI